MFVLKRKYNELQTICEELISENENMKNELNYRDKKQEEDCDFLRWITEYIPPNYIILYCFVDKHINIAFIVCNKDKYTKINYNEFEDIVLYAVSPLTQGTILRNKNHIIEDIPFAVISKMRNENCLYLDEIRSLKFQNQHYGTALMNCIKNIMRQLDLKKISATLGFSDNKPNRDKWYKKNGFQDKTDSIGNGTAIYIEE